MTPRPESSQPIPNNAQLVFKGKIFDVYQWEQVMFDGTIAKFEKVKRPDTALVFPIMDDGSILLIQEEQPGSKPVICPIGGRMDDGEDALDAVKREMLEESGYEANEFILWKAINPLMKVDWVKYFFIAKGLKKVSEPSVDNGEKISFKKVSFDELLQLVSEMNFGQNDKEIIPYFFQALTNEDKKEELKKLFSI